MAKSKAHPGFDAIASRISRKEGISPDRAKAILASSTRNASAKAKADNPNLKRVRSSRVERAVNKARSRMKGAL